MKKIFNKIIIILTITLSLSACSKLNLAPEDNFGSGNFWKNQSQVEGAMIALHSQLRDFQFSIYTIGEIRGATLKTGTGFTGSSSLNSANLILQDIRESSPGVSSWMGLYSNIFQVNNFIYNVEPLTFLDETTKAYLLAQAYGLRAYYYFFLHRVYGTVPLMTEPKTAITTPTSASEGYTARTETEKELLDFIKEEISKSETGFSNNFTTKNRKAQWSLAATLMLKAEVYLWTAKVKIDGQAPSSANTTADLVVAKTALEAVIPKYTLQGNFSEVFSYDKKGNDEIIMALRFQQGEATNGYNSFVYQASDPMAGFVNAEGKALVPNRFQSDVSKVGDPLNIVSGGIIRYEYRFDMFKQYDATDQRRSATFFDYYRAPVTNQNNQGIMMVKFMGSFINGMRVFADDFPIYRLADAILLLAEVKNKQGADPSAEINSIRKRAYGTNSYPSFINGTFEQNELAIFVERRKEFVAEGKIWFDLRRMQDATGSPLAFRKDLPLVGVLETSENYKLLFPLDRATLTNDPLLKQTPNYEGT